MSTILFSPEEWQIQSGQILAKIRCPVLIQPGSLLRGSVFFYHSMDGPIIPTSVACAVYSGSTIVNATPVISPRILQLTSINVGAFTFEYQVPTNAASGLYTIVFSGTYNASAIQIVFPVRLLSS